MAKQKKERRAAEQGMLDNIAGRDEGAAGNAAASQEKSLRIGWMGYVGGVLWAMVLCGAGLAAWLAFTDGA